MITTLKILFYIFIILAVIALLDFLFTHNNESLNAIPGLLIFATIFGIPYIVIKGKKIKEIGMQINIKDIKFKKLKCPNCSAAIKIDSLD